MRGMRVGVAAFVMMAGLLLTAGFASAQVECSTITTLAEWAEAGSCIDTDKVYSFLDSDLPETTLVSISSVIVGDLEVHSINLNFEPDLVSPFSVFLDYTTEIAPGFDRTFNAVSMDSTCPAETPDCLVIKELFDANDVLLTTLSSASGAPDGPDNSIAGETFLRIHETFESTGDNGLLSGTTNTYTQLVPPTGVPGPATLLLLGAGVIGMGLFRRRSQS